MKIYVVVNGEYDDFWVDSVFLDPSKAEICARKTGGDVMEYEADERDHSALKFFKVAYLRGTKELFVEEVTPKGAGGLKRDLRVSIVKRDLRVSIVNLDDNGYGAYCLAENREQAAEMVSMEVVKALKKRNEAYRSLRGQHEANALLMPSYVEFLLWVEDINDDALLWNHHMRYRIITCKTHPNLRWTCQDDVYAKLFQNGGIVNWFRRRVYSRKDFGIHFWGIPSGAGMFPDGSGLYCTTVDREANCSIVECGCGIRHMVLAEEDMLVKAR